VQDLLRFDDPEVAIATLSRWRRAHGEALVVVDQLEELFTLNTTDVQERFAAVLGRIASETDVHVLLSLRDDFLIRCCEQSPLVPVLRDLTALLSLGREELRRALVEPARTRGYRFEDELLVEEMVSLVEGNRGALPLLAFAVSRLWEKRDRERKLLTRAAYEEIGGVEGALAQHAEAMMDGIGPGRQIIVRELFRNLVTAHGTRAVAEREELLSAFPEREDAEEVLRRLVEERLLTTYEVEGEQGAASHHRVEVVHESLLRAWPRLVRWQAQDEEGALLRDQLRQAAHLWEEKGRTGDLLWTGTAYREYALWRERYPGTLTALETDFAKAMAEKAQRRRRSRRLVTGSVVAVAVVVAAVTGLLWRRSELARDRAQAEARRAEASKLTALGRAELDRYPTAAVAYARKSLEIADTPEGRRFVVDALWRSPTARILPVDPPTWGAAMSADDRWLAAFTFSADVLLWGEDGRLARAIGGHRLPDAPPGIAFTPGGEALLTWSPGASRIRVVSVPEGREIRWLPASRHEAPSRYAWWSAYGWAVLPEGVQVLRRERDSNRIVATGVEMWPYDGGTACVVGSWHPATGSRAQDATDSHVVIQRGRRVVLRPVAGPPTTPEREIGNVNDEPPSPGGPWPTLRLSPGGDRVAVGEGDGRLAVFPTAAGAAHQPRFVRMPRPERQFAPAFDSSGTRLLWGSSADRRASLWNLEGPPDAEPLVLLRPDAEITKTGFFDHAGDHAVVVNHSSLTFWPVRQPQVRMLLGHASGVSRLTFTRDARWLVSCANDGVRAWPLAAIVGAAHRVDSGGGWCYGMAVSPDGQQVLIGGPSGAYLAPFSGAPGRWLYQYRTEGDNTYNTQSCAFDASGQLAATAPGYSLPPARKAVRVWDLARSLARSMPLVPPGEAGDGYDWGAGDLAFTAEGQVLASGQGGIRRFDPESGGSTWIWPLPKSWDAIMATSADLRAVLAAGFPIESRNGQGVQVVLLDLAKHTRRSLMSYGNRVTAVALDPSGRALATGDEEGAIRVGPADGSEPHRLCCHVGKVSTVAFSPDGQWVASAAGGEIRLWPTPDLKKAPLHTLPYDELMAKLHALTNLQVVEDAASPTGWKLDVGPFPGWKDVPTW
jgi:WD40 repeat protein